MTTLTAEQLGLLEDIAEDADASFREDYSGRGMYGRRCVGFDLSRHTSPAGFAMRLAVALAEAGEGDLAEEMSQNVGEDSMGLGSIVYFPRVQAPQRDVEPSDEGEDGDEG